MAQSAAKTVTDIFSRQSGCYSRNLFAIGLDHFFSLRKQLRRTTKNQVVIIAHLRTNKLQVSETPACKRCPFWRVANTVNCSIYLRDNKLALYLTHFKSTSFVLLKVRASLVIFPSDCESFTLLAGSSHKCFCSLWSCLTFCLQN